jgi:hypothetical protein
MPTCLQRPDADSSGRLKIDHIETRPTTAEEYQAAVRTLAALIITWQETPMVRTPYPAPRESPKAEADK